MQPVTSHIIHRYFRHVLGNSVFCFVCLFLTHHFSHSHVLVFGFVINFFSFFNFRETEDLQIKSVWHGQVFWYVMTDLIGSSQVFVFLSSSNLEHNALYLILILPQVINAVYWPFTLSRNTSYSACSTNVSCIDILRSTEMKCASWIVWHYTQEAENPTTILTISGRSLYLLSHSCRFQCVCDVSTQYNIFIKAKLHYVLSV